MSSRFKRWIRHAIRAYITYTPIRKGRYPLMNITQKWFGEQETEIVKTKDRGFAKLDTFDSVQFPLFYNIYEWRDTDTILALLKGVSHVLDIGANIGQMSLLFARHVKHVFAFEAIPSKVLRLREQIELNDLESRVTVYELAIGDEDREVIFELPPLSNEGLGSLVIGGIPNAETTTVKMVRLDHFFDLSSIPKIDLVKMDIEGSELYALRGMTALIESHKPILIVELNAKMMKLARYDSNDVLALMQRLGYSCYLIGFRSLDGPKTSVEPFVENYCFLHPSHLDLPNVQKLLKTV